MVGKLSVVALAALAGVSSASPLVPRQATSSAASAASAASSVIASAASGASSAATSAGSVASSAAMSATSMVSPPASGSSSAAPTASTTTTGTQNFPAYPCPAGYSLTYVEQNITVPVNVTTIPAAVGAWANASFFPNVTASEGGNNIGATHTLSVGGLMLNETLVNFTSNATSGAATWTWNLTNGPIMGPGVSVSNYSTVLNIYDPTFYQIPGNTSLLQIYVNFCADNQPIGMQLVETLTQLELGTAQMQLAGNSSMTNTTAPVSSVVPGPTGGASSMAAGVSSPSAVMSATMSAASGAMSASSAAASGASSASSAAASGAMSAMSAASSVGSSASSAARSAVSAASSAASMSA